VSPIRGEKALRRRTSIGENSFEVADHEITAETGARPIEQAATTIRRDTVRERLRTQIDISHKRETNRSVKAGSWSRRGLEEGRFGVYYRIRPRCRRQGLRLRRRCRLGAPQGG
jgi:hypothetical protein